MSPALQFDVLTLFPEMIEGYLRASMLGKACERGLIEIRVWNLRDWATDKHQTTDDRPFGGGAGMVMKPEPIFAAVEALRQEHTTVVFMTPDGEPLRTAGVKQLAAEERHLLILSGHYEGVDQRVRDALVDREISTGDYVLTNGTLPAAILIDAVGRYIPGVLGDENSLTQDAFDSNLLGFPQYTRPAEFRGMPVPEVLLSGDHAAIAAWREQQQIEKTRKRRPDLLSLSSQPSTDS